VSPAFVCWGELLWDLFPDGPRLGGGAANVAYHLARLGNRVALVSRVGDDELGRDAVAELQGAGVDTRAVQIDRERPTGTVRVELEDGEPRFTLAEQAAWDRIEYGAEVRALIASARALCYGTLAQRTALGLGALWTALGEAPPDVVRVCDLNVRLPHTTREAVDAALFGANVVKLNRAEAGVLETLYSVSDAVEWLLRERGIGLCALTLGAEGVELRSAAGRAVHRGYPVEGGDRVGAGDAFTAALAHLWVRGASLEVMAERANRYAAFVASQRGAMPEVPVELVRGMVP
jgi:fructokinase